jgi:hypothetical protein
VANPQTSNKHASSTSLMLTVFLKQVACSKVLNLPLAEIFHNPRY